MIVAFAGDVNQWGKSDKKIAFGEKMQYTIPIGEALPITKMKNTAAGQSAADKRKGICHEYRSENEPEYAL